MRPSTQLQNNTFTMVRWPSTVRILIKGRPISTTSSRDMHVKQYRQSAIAHQLHVVKCLFRLRQRPVTIWKCALPHPAKHVQRSVVECTCNTRTLVKSSAHRNSSYQESRCLEASQLLQRTRRVWIIKEGSGEAAAPATGNEHEHTAMSSPTDTHIAIKRIAQYNSIAQ